MTEIWAVKDWNTHLNLLFIPGSYHLESVDKCKGSYGKFGSLKIDYLRFWLLRRQEVLHIFIIAVYTLCLNTRLVELNMWFGKLWCQIPVYYHSLLLCSTEYFFRFPRRLIMLWCVCGRKVEITSPFDFHHISHAGFDSKETCSAFNVDDELRALFDIVSTVLYLRA